MNHSPSQSRFTLSRSHEVTSRIGPPAIACLRARSAMRVRGQVSDVSDQKRARLPITDLTADPCSLLFEHWLLITDSCHRYSRSAWRSAILIAPLASSRPVQTLANMSSTMKSASAAAAFSPTDPRPPAVSVRLAAWPKIVFLGSDVHTGFASYALSGWVRYPTDASSHLLY